ncbi:hypothetical protein TNCV_2005781 [Trichonephila clavipes]|nr:hypothetical protein TNCV_2005781 [Trichonephila clavipes]
MRRKRERKPEVSRSSLVVKVTDSWAACHEFEPSTSEDLRVGERCTLNLWKLEGGVTAQVCPLSLDHGTKLRGPSPKALK